MDERTVGATSQEEHWWQRAVVYQIWPRSFQDSDGDGIGDLPGITRRLPYLAWLGIDVIWLSPVYQSPMVDMGYDISDYRAIAPEFGTMTDFDDMLTRAHELGLRVVMDLVVNHSSSEHPWFIAARSGRDNPFHNHYIWRESKDGHEPSNAGSYFGGSAWEWDERCSEYYLHLFAKEQPDLNWDNPEVRRGVYDMMCWWLDKGIDGFRMDVISLISKDQYFVDGTPGPGGYSMSAIRPNGPHVHEYLREMRREALAGYDIMCVGECPGVTIDEAKHYANLDGSELDMVFQFEHTELESDPMRGKWVCTRPRLSELKHALARWEIGLEGVAWNSLFWSNHDQPRIVSRWGNDTPIWREASAKMLMTCLLLMKGTPYLYQGDELGMCNYPFADIDDFRDLESIDAWRMLREDCHISDEEALAALRAHSRDNARTPMQWDAGKAAGFTSGTPWMPIHPNYPDLNVEEQRSRADSPLSYCRRLLHLRHESDLVVHGSFELLDADNESTFTYRRTLGAHVMVVSCNFTSEAAWVVLPHDDSTLLPVLSSREDSQVKVAEAHMKSSGIVLAPYEAQVLCDSQAFKNLRDILDA